MQIEACLAWLWMKDTQSWLLHSSSDLLSSTLLKSNLNQTYSIFKILKHWKLPFLNYTTNWFLHFNTLFSYIYGTGDKTSTLNIFKCILGTFLNHGLGLGAGLGFLGNYESLHFWYGASNGGWSLRKRPSPNHDFQKMAIVCIPIFSCSPIWQFIWVCRENLCIFISEIGKYWDAGRDPLQMMALSCWPRADKQFFLKADGTLW